MITKKTNKKSKPINFTVLFVCSGNSCRSPMAKGIFDKIVKDNKNDNVNIISLSAGTSASANQLPNEFAQKAVIKYGADIKHHLSAPITKERIEMADLILVMEEKHKNTVLEMSPIAKNKTFVITKYVGKNNQGIVDPLGQPFEKYEETAKNLYELLVKVYKKINDKWGVK
jgi:protein-tyrosine-phosphatase